MTELFELRRLKARLWLAALVTFALVLSLFFPPSFWLCGVGVCLVIVSLLANSVRSGQWFSWQMEGSLNWFEGWSAYTGIVFMSVPLIVICIRSLLRASTHG